MSIAKLAKSAARGLADCELRLVLAESCTAGLVAASLGKVAGISRFFCGSAVTYRNATKAAWLDVPESLLSNPGPVSREVAEKMACGALSATPEADLAAAVTGHLGPGAPSDCDGLIFCGVARRGAFGRPPTTNVEPFRLQASSRVARQKEAAEIVLSQLAATIDSEQTGLESLVPLSQWKALVDGTLDATCQGIEPPGDAGPSSGLIFPGAFHPLHEGHRKMAAVAARRSGRSVEFELSIVNVDKRPLPRHEAARRVAQFLPDSAVWLTHAATFAEKSLLFPGATFIVGIDTIARIGNVKYYADSDAQRLALSRIAESGCRFLVFGRLVDDCFKTLASVSLPAELRQLCDEVGEIDFRHDISSTRVRDAQLQQ